MGNSDPEKSAADRFLADDSLREAAATGIIGYRLRRAQLNVFQRFLTVFETLQLRPAEYSVLVLIADNPGRKQTEIAAALGIKRANFVTLAHELEARSLIERRPARDDKRANALHMTADGTAFLNHARTLHEAMEQDLVTQLGGPQARDRFIDMLERLS